MAEEIGHPQLLLNPAAGFEPSEPSIYTSPHIPDPRTEYPNLGGAAIYYVSGTVAAGGHQVSVLGSGVAWIAGTSPAMTGLGTW